MNNFFTDFLHSFLALTILSAICYALGHIFMSFFKQTGKNEFHNFFVKIAFGSISIVIIYAFYRTIFITIFTGCLLSLAYYCYYNRQNLTIRIKKQITSFEPNVALIHLIGLIAIALGTIYLLQFDDRLLNHQDLAFYARLGSSLLDSGIEIGNPEPLFFGNYKASIYHFYNEWMVALLMNFSSFSSLKILQLIVIPYLSALSLIGALNLVNSYLPRIHILEKMLLAFVFIAIPSILSMTAYAAKNISLNMPYSVLHGGIVIMKVKIIVILFLLFFKDANKEFSKKEIISFSLIPLFWNTLIPAFLGAYLLYFFYLVLKRRAIPVHLFVQLLLPLMFIPVYLTFANYMYSLDASPIKLEIGTSLFSYLSEIYNNKSYLISTILFFVLPITLAYLVTVLFYERMFLFVEKKFTTKLYLDKELVLMIVFLSLSALLSFAILRELFNARQILMNLFYPLINILVFLLIINIYKKWSFNSRIMILTIMVFVIIHAISFRPVKVIDPIITHFERMQKKETRLFFATDINRSQSPFSLYSKPYEQYLRYIEDYKPMRLDILRDKDSLSPKDQLEYTGSVSKQIFYRFVHHENLLNDIESAKIRFIEEFNIDYLLIDSALLIDENSYIKQLTIDSVFAFDKGVVILKLN